MARTTKTESAALAQIEYRIRTVEESLRTKIGRLQRSLDEATDALDDGFHVNGLGIVQRDGDEIDRLAALREELYALRGYAENDAEKIAAATVEARAANDPGREIE